MQLKGGKINRVIRVFINGYYLFIKIWQTINCIIIFVTVWQDNRQVEADDKPNSHCTNFICCNVFFVLIKSLKTKKKFKCEIWINCIMQR